MGCASGLRVHPNEQRRAWDSAPEEIPTEDQDRDCQRDPSNSLIAATGYAEYTTDCRESLTAGLIDTGNTARSQKEADLDYGHKDNMELYSSIPILQLCSDLPSPHMIDSSMNSGPCLTVASQVTHDPRLSDTGESNVLPGSSLNIETMAPSSSSDHYAWPSEPTLSCSQRDDSTCCSPDSSGFSLTSRPLERGEEAADCTSHESPSQVTV
ncbi:hypothetical protein SKAU_G00350760 [Synaphobranchus kaupii]|uniref:Uncharacterized protein n=1 Tax=Synaphobranchus kaupii TaxID=118154 RepID=A0A9Q1EKK7_SYNKA|nr:hypothetical protein SKAU_G00350760 [Synaphobranchus kaupii]